MSKKNRTAIFKALERRRLRRIDSLSDEAKDLICDNCLDSDDCKNAYNHVFVKNQCLDVYDEIEDEITPTDDEEEGAYYED